MKSICLFFLCFVTVCTRAQVPNSVPKIKLLTSGTNTSIRGLSVVNNEVIWVSGSHGTVGKSTNGGKDWKWRVVKGFEKTDFRDIEAFDAVTAIIMGVGEPGYILKTIDGGDTWKVVYENKTPGIFMDAMEFWNAESGIVIGDPLNGKFFIARSFDGGNSWKEIPDEFKPAADSGEACFASSGTNIRALDNDEAVFISGGKKSSVFIRDQKITLPIVQGTESTGANSIAVWDRYRRKGGNQLVVVGGDFTKDSVATKNCFYSVNRGKTWKASKRPPHGYRSCVEYLDKKVLLTCGTSGVDYSSDNAATWTLISKDSFHVCRIAKIGTAVFLAGSNGKIAMLEFASKKKKN